MLVTATVALGTTAPEESLKVPVKAPVAAVWLKSDGASIIEHKIRATQLATKKRLNHL
jgi:hypothetical protein